MPYKNKADQREASRRHYQRNRQKYIARAAETKKQLKAKWEEFKRSLKCVNCGFSHPAALDFHHVIHAPDNEKVHKLLHRQAYKRVMEEIQKCVPLCANCHRIHHYEEHVVKRHRRKKKLKASRRGD